MESQFEVSGVPTERDKFGLVTGMLLELSARKITHLLQAPLANRYTALKAVLLSVLQLTNMQHMEALFSMDNISNKRPMDLLSEMMDLVRPGEEKTEIFPILFMPRLPAQVCCQLTEDNHSDLLALAAHAD